MDPSKIYTNETLSLIESLDLQRIAELEKFVTILLLVFAVLVISFLKFRTNFFPLLGVSFFVLIGSFYMLNAKYKSAVERDLLPRLIKGIDSDFTYRVSEHIKLDDINALHYFSHKIENIFSDGTIQIVQNRKSAGLSFVTLESVMIDTEEGEHETERFDGAIVVLDLESTFDQKHLLTVERSHVPVFEAGNYLNQQNMGLQIVQVVDKDFTLYSENGSSRLDQELIKKVLEFKADLKTDSWTVFSGNRAYIFIEGINGGFGISLLKSLKEQRFVLNYMQLLKRIKGLISIDS